MTDFEDLRLCDLLDKVSARAKGIAESRNVSSFAVLGRDVQAVYDFFVGSQKAFEEQQPLLKNLFSSFNYAAVIINDALQKKALDKEGTALLNECLEIIIACCANLKKQILKQ